MSKGGDVPQEAVQLENGLASRKRRIIDNNLPLSTSIGANWGITGPYNKNKIKQ